MALSFLSRRRAKIQSQANSFHLFLHSEAPTICECRSLFSFKFVIADCLPRSGGRNPVEFFVPPCVEMQSTRRTLSAPDEAFCIPSWRFLAKVLLVYLLPEFPFSFFKFMLILLWWYIRCIWRSSGRNSMAISVLVR